MIHYKIGKGLRKNDSRKGMFGTFSFNLTRKHKKMSIDDIAPQIIQAIKKTFKSNNGRLLIHSIEFDFEERIEGEL